MCTSPLLRFRLKVDTAPKLILGVSTKFQVKSLREVQALFVSYSAFKNYFDTYMDYQYIKCRKCNECKAQYASEWSIRCAHEYQIRKLGSFITLTVDSGKAGLFNTEKYLKSYCKRCSKGNRFIKYPIDYTLCKGMILDQLKRMRDKILKKYGIKIRYFGCGEYGSIENRPHYHILIFGFNFPDRKFLKYSDKGYPIYVSEYLNDLWPFGIATVQDVDHKVCMYTAKYCMKKLKYNDNQSEYEAYYGREPEFLFMSKGNCQSNRCKYIDDIIKNCKGMKSLRDLNNPYCKFCDKTRGGIGYDWFLRYKDDVLKKGYITLEGIKYPIPNYYLKILKLTDEKKFDKIHLEKLNSIDEFLEEHSEERSQERLDVKAKVLKGKLKLLSRM